MKNFVNKAWGSVKRIWSRIAKTVSKFIDDFSIRRVKNMKGYKIIAAATATAATQATQQVDSVAVQMDELDDWNVVQCGIP